LDDETHAEEFPVLHGLAAVAFKLINCQVAATRFQLRGIAASISPGMTVQKYQVSVGLN
jgi:hypothetical protein